MPVRQIEQGRLLLGNGFNPAGIPGFQIWLKGGVGVTLNTTNVSNWANQSPPGTAYDAAQGTGILQPAQGTVPLNGILGVTFSGTKRLTPSTLTGLLNAASGISTFSVIQSSAGVSQNIFSISQGNAASADARAGVGISSGNAINFYGSPTDSNSTVPNVGGGTHTTAPEIIHTTWDLPTQTVNVYQNGALVGNSTSYQTSANTFPSTDPSSACIGDYISFFSDPLAGDLFELLIYSRALSISEQFAVKRYLSQRYAITVN